MFKKSLQKNNKIRLLLRKISYTFHCGVVRGFLLFFCNATNVKTVNVIRSSRPKPPRVKSRECRKATSHFHLPVVQLDTLDTRCLMEK